MLDVYFLNVLVIFFVTLQPMISQCAHVSYFQIIKKGLCFSNIRGPATDFSSECIVVSLVQLLKYQDLRNIWIQIKGAVT